MLNYINDKDIEGRIKSLSITKLKTFLTAIFCVCRCILFPKTKIIIASATRTQANEVLSKITDDLMKNYSWGSENLKREVIYASVGLNKAVIEFANGSWIKVATASDTGRGLRANILVSHCQIA